MITKLLEVLYDMVKSERGRSGESMPEVFLEDEESTTEKGKDDLSHLTKLIDSLINLHNKDEEVTTEAEGEEEGTTEKGEEGKDCVS